MTAVYKFNHALRFARTEVLDNGVRGSGRHGREWRALGSRDIDGKSIRPIKRERKSQARRLSDWESANQSEGNGRYVLTSNVKHHTSDVPKCVNSKL
jgi:hypothetical protein